jgi:hypothetical protein
MKRLMPPGLITFLQNNRNMMEADLFVITLPTGTTFYVTSGQWDITVPEGAGGWSGPTTTFLATQYGRWSRGTITSEATYNMSGNTMALTCVPQPATAYPGLAVGMLNAALNGLFDAATVTVYTAYFAMGNYGLLAGGVPSPSPTLVASGAASPSGEFASPAVVGPLNTLGATFIAIAANNYDTNPSLMTLTDTIGGNPSGNVWTRATTSPSYLGTAVFVPFFFYCYNPHVGASHVFTLASTGDANPNLCVTAFSGMPTSGAPEGGVEGIRSEGGNYGPMAALSTAVQLLSPNNVGDLILSAAGIGNIIGRTVVIDNSFTISGDSHPFNLAGITGAYATATQGVQFCSGNVTITGTNTAVISMLTTAGMVSQQTCSGTVIFNGDATFTIDVPDSTGFTADMVVTFSGFSGVVAGNINSTVAKVLSTAAGSITFVSESIFSSNTYTGQSGTVSMIATVAGFTSGAATLNGALNCPVVLVSGGNVTVTSGSLSNGNYTGQTNGTLGIPVLPYWSWGGTLSNESGAGMVIFPGNPGGTGVGGIETKLYGRITKLADINRVHVEFEVSDPMFLLNMRVPRRLMQPNCPWSVTDLNCTLNAAGNDINGNAMTQPFTLASGTQYVLFPATPFAQPEGYFTQGVVKCTSGANAGLAQSVKLHANGELTLMNPWLLPPNPGDTFSVLVGCDHTPTTCQVKFGNLINFGGTPFVPPPESAV